jgi:type I restriction enzyme S subunit
MKQDKKRKLPTGWRWAKLGGKNGIAEIVNGATPSTDEPQYWKGDILWATPADLGNLRSIYIEDTERKITKAGLNSCSTKLLPVGTVLLTSRAPVGNLAITKRPLCTNQGFKSFIPKDGIDSLYLYFAIRIIIPDILKDVHVNTFGEITKEQIQHFEIPLPPTIDDQIRIATQLELKMAEVEKMRQAALRRKEAISAMQGAILRAVFPWKEDDELPAGWRWEALENLFTIDNMQIDSSNPLFSVLPFIGMDNIESNTRRFIPNENNGQNGDSACFLFNDKHVLYGKLRPYLNKVYLPDKPGRCSMELLPLQPKDGFTREFIALILQSERFVAYAVRHSKGGRMPRANTDKLLKLRVAIPVASGECRAIASGLEPKLAEIVKISQYADRELEAIEALPGAIVREVFDLGPESGDDDSDKEQVQQ